MLKEMPPQDEGEKRRRAVNRFQMPSSFILNGRRFGRLVREQKSYRRRRCSSFAMLYFACFASSLTLSSGRVQAAEATLDETIEYIGTKFSQCETITLWPEKLMVYVPQGNIEWVGHRKKTVEITVRHAESDRIVIEESGVSDIKYRAKSRAGSMYWKVKSTFTITREVDLQELTTAPYLADDQIYLECSRKDCIPEVHVGQVLQENSTEKFFNYVALPEAEKFDWRVNASRILLLVCFEYANQIVAAFTHAIKTAGGREELFGP